MRSVLLLLLALPLLAPPGVCACRVVPSNPPTAKRSACKCAGCQKKDRQAPPERHRTPCCPVAEERPYTATEPAEVPALISSDALPVDVAEALAPFLPAPPPPTPPPVRPPILRC